MSTTKYSLEKIDELVSHIQEFRYHKFLELFLKLSVRNRAGALARVGFLETGKHDSDELNARYVVKTPVVEQVMDIVRWMRDREDLPALREGRSKIRELEANQKKLQDEVAARDETIDSLIRQRDILIDAVGLLTK